MRRFNSLTAVYVRNYFGQLPLVVLEVDQIAATQVRDGEA